MGVQGGLPWRRENGPGHKKEGEERRARLISGELAQGPGQLGPILFCGEKKKGRIGGGGVSSGLKKALFQDSEKERKRFPCLLPIGCQTRSVPGGGDAARPADCCPAQWGAPSPATHFTFDLFFPGTLGTGAVGAVAAAVGRDGSSWGCQGAGTFG